MMIKHCSVSVSQKRSLTALGRGKGFFMKNKIMVLGALFFWAAPGLAKAAFPVSAAAALTVETLDGSAQILQAGSAEWQPVKAGMPLGLGDRIAGGDDTIFQIKTPFGRLELSEKADLLIKGLPGNSQKGAIVLELNFGMIKADHAPQNAGMLLELHTPNAMAATDHGFLSVWVYPFLSHLYTRLDVFRGQAHFSDTAHPAWLQVAAGQHVTAGLNSEQGPKEEPFVPGQNSFLLSGDISGLSTTANVNASAGKQDEKLPDAAALKFKTI